MAQAGAGGAANLFGNETVRTIVIWGFLMQMVQPILAPLIEDIEQTQWHDFPDRRMPAPDAIDAAIKGHMTVPEARDEVKKSGFGDTVFDRLLASAGEPPSWGVLLEAWRRGLIPLAGLGPDSTSLQQGVFESRLKNKWLDTIEKLQWQLPSPGVIIEAWVRAQTPEANARDLLRKNGVDDATATLMYDSAGRPPAPGELLELHRRGVIPRDGLGPDQLTLQQGYFETDLKNKWWETWAHLLEYRPPPRTITALVREGALTDAQALDLFKQSGLTDQLAAVYLGAAHHQRIAADKELAKADVLRLYRDKLVDHATALALLGGLHYNPAAAGWLLAMEDFREAAALYQGAEARLRALFLARKLSDVDLLKALKELGVPDAQVETLTHRWTIERQARVQELTAAEWVDAAFYQIISQADALAGLQSLGWTPWDAWVRLGVRLHGKSTEPEPSKRALVQ